MLDNSKEGFSFLIGYNLVAINLGKDQCMSYLVQPLIMPKQNFATKNIHKVINRAIKGRVGVVGKCKS